MVLLSSIPRQEFVALIKAAPKKIPSKTGKAEYYNIQTDGALITMDCDTRSGQVKIKVDELYKAYQKMDFIYVNELKYYLSSRVYSPSFALLVAMGLYHNEGGRISV